MRHLIAVLAAAVSVALPAPAVAQKHHHHLTTHQVGKAVAKKYHWHHGAQWRCLDRLWTRESRWLVRAHNPTSGAHGIPQALPGWKMGPGWRSNPWVQIRWGLRYIKQRYGSPCAAWGHSQSTGWY